MRYAWNATGSVREVLINSLVPPPCRAERERERHCFLLSCERKTNKEKATPSNLQVLHKFAGAIRTTLARLRPTSPVQKGEQPLANYLLRGMYSYLTSRVSVFLVEDLCVHAEMSAGLAREYAGFVCGREPLVAVKPL